VSGRTRCPAEPVRDPGRLALLPVDIERAPAGLRGWRAQLGYIDAAHRVHARVEDRIRTGKDCGISRFPSHDFAMNSAWLAVASIAAVLLSWLRLIALDGDLARAEPKTLRLPGPARRWEAGPWRPPATAENPRRLALGRGHRHRLGPDHRPATRTLTSTKPPPRYGRSNPGARGTPGHRPASRALSYPDPKITNCSAVQSPSGPAIRPRESSGLATVRRRTLVHVECTERAAQEFDTP
jgi:hypothetical protein